MCAWQIKNRKCSASWECFACESMQKYAKNCSVHTHERNMCMVEVFGFQWVLHTPIHSPPLSRPAANALVTPDPFSCWIANCLCMASLILFFFFSQFSVLVYFACISSFLLFFLCFFPSCSYSLIECPPICHDDSSSSSNSSSQFVPLHFVVTSLNVYDFLFVFLFIFANTLPPLSPFYLMYSTQIYTTNLSVQQMLDKLLQSMI